MTTVAVQALERLGELWRLELDATRQAQLVLREAIEFTERVERGTALGDLVFHHRERSNAGKTVVWFAQAAGKVFGDHRLKAGYPAVLWKKGQPASRAERGTISRVTAKQIAVRFDARYDRFIENGPVQLDQEDSDATFQRGRAAVNAFIQRGELTVLRELLFGEGAPSFRKLEHALTFRDPDLDDSQREAVRFAMSAGQIALLHGPPGTGKTRTLIEVVRQALQLRHRVLVTAASNTAVDNLAERLVACGVKTLRLGQPERIGPELEAQTLGYHLATAKEKAEADELIRKARRASQRRAGELRREAHLLLNAARARILRRARVVCCTAAGVDAVPLGDERFDMVLLDEATQAPDPVALAALQRGGILILAGDPQQLAPTVISREAAERGLATTLFERVALRWGDRGLRMLQVQYRMHSALMEFPSASMYGGKLRADDSNRSHVLEDLPGVLPEPEARPSPWRLLDTSELDDSEQRAGRTSSYKNPAHAKITVREVRQLLSRGVLPEQIAAITPYQGQVDELKKMLAEEVAAGLEIGSVDGFQGREKEAIVLDLVRKNDRGDIGFLSDIRRTNVAITRAKRFLAIVASGATLKGHPYYAELLRHAKHTGAWAKQLA